MTPLNPQQLVSCCRVLMVSGICRVYCLGLEKVKPARFTQRLTLHQLPRQFCSLSLLLWCYLSSELATILSAGIASLGGEPGNARAAVASQPTCGKAFGLSLPYLQVPQAEYS